MLDGMPRHIQILMDTLELFSETLGSKRDTKALRMPEMEFLLYRWRCLTSNRNAKVLFAFRHR